MKSLFVYLFALSTVFSTSAFADGDFSLEVGVRQQSGEAETTGVSSKSEIGYQFGGVGAFQLNGAWYFRTGLLYTQRNLTVETTTPTKNKISMNYADIPLTAMYKFEDYAGVFAGLIASVNLDHSIEGGGNLTDVKSPYMPIVVGGTFKFAPQMGGTIYLEMGGGEVAKNYKNFRAIGANLAITF